MENVCYKYRRASNLAWWTILRTPWKWTVLFIANIKLQKQKKILCAATVSKRCQLLWNALHCLNRYNTDVWKNVYGLHKFEEMWCYATKLPCSYQRQYSCLEAFTWFPSRHSASWQCWLTVETHSALIKAGTLLEQNGCQKGWYLLKRINDRVKTPEGHKMSG